MSDSQLLLSVQRRGFQLMKLSALDVPEIFIERERILLDAVRQEAEKRQLL